MTIKNCTLIEALTCNEDDLVVEVAKKIREHLLRHIYVVDSENKPVGVISTTDINNRIVAEGKDPNNIKANEIMTSPIETIDEDMDEREAYKVCVKGNIVACPVTKEGKISGIISVNEILRKLTDVQI
jgi:CBS domain-containing protein